MPKDYRKSSRPKHQGPTRRTNNRPNKQPGAFLHGPSFVIGIVVGAILVIVGAYAPEFLEDQPAQATSAPAQPEERKLEFEFPKILAESEVATNPEPYEVDLPDESGEVAAEFLIQAASFRNADEAETLRAQLLLQDMPVSMTRVALKDGNWYRVTVGPYDSETLATRALTKLREQNLRAIMLKKEGR